MTQVTKQYVINSLARDPEFVVKFIGRALVVLFNNQETDEQRDNATKKDNGIGFTGADARTGSISAKYYLKHGKLEDWQVQRWTRPNKDGTPRIAKYWKQLDNAAKKKAG